MCPAGNSVAVSRVFSSLRFTFARNRCPNSFGICIRHSGEGLWNMGNWLIEATDSIPENVAIGIEVTRGPVVESLMARGFDVHSINPKQLDRFRDRFSAAGAKDDRRDAMVLASALRTDRRHFRSLEPQYEDITILRSLSRRREELVSERNRWTNRLSVDTDSD